MAGLWYLTWAFVVLGPLWRDGDARLDNLWYLYMSPAFDEQPASRLWVLAGPSLLLGLAGLVNPYSRRLGECLSRPRAGRGGARAGVVRVAAVQRTGGHRLRHRRRTVGVGVAAGGSGRRLVLTGAPTRYEVQLSDFFERIVVVLPMWVALFIHLLVPLAVASAVAATTASADASWLARLPDVYAILALPHGVWAIATLWFEASPRTVAGGFVGLQLWLFAAWWWVSRSAETHAANGWLLYLLAAPLALGAGAVVGRRIARPTRP